MLQRGRSALPCAFALLRSMGHLDVATSRREDFTETLTSDHESPDRTLFKPREFFEIVGVLALD